MGRTGPSDMTTPRVPPVMHIHILKCSLTDFERQSNRQRERIFLPLIHSPSAPNSQGWFILKLEARNSILIAHVGGRGPEDFSHHLLPPRKH